MRVAIIGGGLAGLSAALTLQDAGVEVEIYESSDRVGGRVATDNIDGFLLDRGFQLINVNYPEIVRLDIENDLHFKVASKSIDFYCDKKIYSIADPRSNPFSALNSASGTLVEKIKFLPYLLSKSTPEKSVEDELISLGVLYQRILKPFLTGVFLVPPAEIDAVRGKELIRSFVTGKAGLPKEGAGKLAEVIARKVNRIHLNQQIDSLDQFSGQSVIVATDVTTAAQLLDISNIPTLASSTTWYHEVPVGFTAAQNLRIDSDAKGPIVNSIVISNFLPTYAPEGRALLSTTTIDYTSESEVRRHLAPMWGIETSTWPLIAKYEIPKALPIFPPGHQRVQSSRVREKQYIAGDFRTAASQNGALLSGRLAAQELLLDQGI